MKPSTSHPHSKSPAAARQMEAKPCGPVPTPHSQSGVALVVTLIMLSVITFMAVSFLVLSRAEHGSVATETDQTQARLAAEAGLQRAIAQSLAPMMAQTNEFRYDLLVSTNYINPLGFVSGVANVTNVNYDYKVGGAPIIQDQDRLQNLANLWYDPRPPVFITNRSSALGGSEFRFFLNLNRNTNLAGPVFDPTGWLQVTNKGVGVADASKAPVFSYFVGDPQWIGVLASPDRPHAADNRFISRFAYLLVPAGKTLDFNYLHNYAKEPSLGLAMGGGDGFLRNQGVGAWEDNLAGFLVDLNTNLWPYPSASPPGPTYPAGQQYAYNYANLGIANTGTAFDDALALLRYRYNYSAGSLFSVSQLYGTAGVRAFANDYIDAYLTARPDWVTWPPVSDPDVVPLNAGSPAPWAGAPNTNHFFTPQEFFDRSKMLASGMPPSTVTFSDRLLGAGNNTQSSYDQYTFYRMLAQLGSDTAGDADRINLNYRNLDNQGHVVPNMETNFLPWIPEHFFTNTANALLRTYGYNFTITNIQIYPTNFYTPSVHRLLQLAANIYDASTNRFGVANFPTVFRPLFRKTGDGRVLIAGYREVQDDSIAVFSSASGTTVQPSVILGYNQDTLPLYDPTQAFKPGETNEPMVTGIPLVVGAKKGFPNFNEFGMDTKLEFGRKLRFVRDGSGNITSTNAMFLLTLTNTFGFEAWNSYTSTYPRNLEVRMDAVLYALLTPTTNFTSANNLLHAPGGAGDVTDPVATRIYRPAPSTIPANTWLGYTDPAGVPPARTSFRAVTQAYSWTNAQFSSSPTTVLLPFPGVWDSATIIPPPGLYLTLRPMVRFALVDTEVNPHRIIDYVSLDATTTATNLMTMMKGNVKCDIPAVGSVDPGALWCDTLYNGVPVGVWNQISVNLGNADDPLWPAGSHQADVDFFRAQFPGQSPLFFPNGTFSTTNTFYTAYGGERPLTYHFRWQVNDPLVHYTVPDLVDLLGTKPAMEFDTTSYPAMAQVGGLDFFTSQPVGATAPLNDHYRPWGGNPVNSADTATPTNWRLEVKDPMVTRSEDWNFPTNKYPNIGWLGRVHRGTPWQTVYLKSTTNDWSRWKLWSGDNGMAFNFDGQGRMISMPDAMLSLPENDRSLLDLFSATLNDNAAHGRLSVNQEGLAGWSAVLSGVAVLRNTLSDLQLRPYGTKPQLVSQLQLLPRSATPQVIPPAGQFDPLTTPTNAWPALARIVNAINTTRAYHPDFRALQWNYNGTIGWTNTFEHLGEVLAVPELTVASPFLNRGTMVNTLIDTPDRSTLTYQTTVGLNDEMYERIPQQILGLLQCDHTPRFVIFAYGQALKPADHSIYTGSTGGGRYFQLCTNYQITAEVATRAVVRIDGAPTHPHAVIESFNVLPPD